MAPRWSRAPWASSRQSLLRDNFCFANSPAAAANNAGIRVTGGDNDVRDNVAVAGGYTGVRIDASDNVVTGNLGAANATAEVYIPNMSTNHAGIKDDYMTDNLDPALSNFLVP